MKVLLIRHGKTRGNLEGRYVGSTDEPLLEEAAASLSGSEYRRFMPDRVYCSRMLRCRQSAELLFGSGYVVREGLEETNFGEFEYKNYEELNGNPAYQEWIDSGGLTAFPGGEAGVDFRNRCSRAFQACIEEAVMQKAERVAFVVHGGTIMSAMEAFAHPKADFYSWQVNNGRGYLTELVLEENNTFFLRVIDDMSL